MTLIIDRNNYQLDGSTSEVMKLNPLEDKLKAFGFDVEAVDGHSIEALIESLPNGIIRRLSEIITKPAQAAIPVSLVTLNLNKFFKLFLK